MTVVFIPVWQRRGQGKSRLLEWKITQTPPNDLPSSLWKVFLAREAPGWPWIWLKRPRASQWNYVHTENERTLHEVNNLPAEMCWKPPARQTACFHLGIKPYLNSGVTRIIPHAATYRNVFLRHPAAPGMIIWPTTARAGPTLHLSQAITRGRWRVKTSPFACHHKNTTVCNEAVSSILTEGRGAIVSLTMKGRLWDLL